MHDASSLHFDLRLQVGRVLKSWAVPRGPSTNPQDQRLAIQTEDHPLEYANFEGVIPDGHYGAGTVMIWDKGSFENKNRNRFGRTMSMSRALARGKVEFVLHGRKICGAYALVRTGSGNNNERWLLVKENDAHADARRNPVSTQTRSVVSGCTLKQIQSRANPDKSP